MEEFIYETQYSRIKIYSELLGLKEAIQSYLYSYAKINERSNENQNIDATVYIFQSKNKFTNRETSINQSKKEVGVVLDNFDRENQLYLKRLLINLNNRILESKGFVFLHASSVCYNDKGIMFIGDRGNGKTTNMLYMLQNEGTEYVSNDRTAFKLDKKMSKIIMTGIPSRINVRPGTIEADAKLKEKLKPILVTRGYDEMVKYESPKSMKSRMILSIQELKESLGTQERPVCELDSIIILEYNPNIDFQLEKITFQELITTLENQRINGVFSGTKELEMIANADYVRIEDIIKNSNLNVIKVKQNRNNIDRILNILNRNKGVNKDDRE